MDLILFVFVFMELAMLWEITFAVILNVFEPCYYSVTVLLALSIIGVVGGE